MASEDLSNIQFKRIFMLWIIKAKIATAEKGKLVNDSN